MARARKAVNEVTVVDEVTVPSTTGEQAVDTAQPTITPEPAVEQVPSGEPVQANNAQDTPQETEQKTTQDTVQDAQQQTVLNALPTIQPPPLIQSPEEALAKFKALAAQAKAAQQQVLGFTVVNNEFFDMVEPATMTTIRKQSRQHIQCHSTEQKVRAINNIKQLIALGRKLEIAP